MDSEASHLPKLEHSRKGGCHPSARYLQTVVKHIQLVKEQIIFSCYKVLVVGKISYNGIDSNVIL